MDNDEVIRVLEELEKGDPALEGELPPSAALQEEEIGQRQPAYSPRTGIRQRKSRKKKKGMGPWRLTGELGGRLRDSDGM